MDTTVDADRYVIISKLPDSIFNIDENEHCYTGYLVKRTDYSSVKVVQ
jgi:hypothetical protein